MVWRGTPVTGLGGTQNPASPPAGVTGLPVAQLPVRPLDSYLPGVGTGVPGKPVTHASGNPAVSSMPYWGPVKRPLGEPRPLGVGQETAWRGGAYFSLDKLEARDRHLISKVGTELTGRGSGFTDPPMDGPARPSYQTVNRTINYQAGSDATRNQDDLSRPYARNAQGMFIGEQGSGWIGINGGVPGMWIPYGSYAGYTAGPVQGIQSPVPQGSPGDGRQSVFSGPPHGLHSQTLSGNAQTLVRYLQTPQMQPPRIDRPSNSTAEGQSYSQTVLSQGQTGPHTGVTPHTVARTWQTRNSPGWRGFGR
jgi:hypothetical protein